MLSQHWTQGFEHGLVDGLHGLAIGGAVGQPPLLKSGGAAEIQISMIIGIDWGCGWPKRLAALLRPC